MWMVLNSLLYCSPLSSVQLLNRVWLFATPWPEPARLPCLSPTPGACSTRVHRVGDAIQPSHSVVPFSSCFQSFPASGSFLMSQLTASGDQNIEASASVLLMNIQDRFTSGLTGLISLQSKRLSRVFSNTTVQTHQFFSAQLSLWSNSHIRTWLLKKITALTRRTFVGKVMCLLFNVLPKLVIPLFPRSKLLLILWLQSPSAVILEPKKIKSVNVSIVCPPMCH